METYFLDPSFPLTAESADEGFLPCAPPWPQVPANLLLTLALTLLAAEPGTAGRPPGRQPPGAAPPGRPNGDDGNSDGGATKRRKS